MKCRERPHWVRGPSVGELVTASTNTLIEGDRLVLRAALPLCDRACYLFKIVTDPAHQPLS